MIKVIVDSVANLPEQVMQEFDITFIPTYLTFGAETFRDLIDLTSADFYQRLAESEELPTTNQPSVHDFEALFRDMFERYPGATLLCVHVSGTLSGTVESAHQAAALFPGADIHVFDTRSLSLAQGLMAREAARMVNSGEPIDSILPHLADMRDKMQIYFVMDTLEYLHKGGRIGRAGRLLGTLLDTKPMLTLSDGTVEPSERYHTRSRALTALRDRVLQGTDGLSALQLGVMHAACEPEARALAGEICEVLQPAVFLFGDLSPALGTYTGPGTLGVCWWSPDM